jgi:hypothetical protein
MIYVRGARKVVLIDPDLESLFLSENAFPDKKIMQNLCVLAPSEKLCMGRSLDNEAILGRGRVVSTILSQCKMPKLLLKFKKNKNILNVKLF